MEEVVNKVNELNQDEAMRFRLQSQERFKTEYNAQMNGAYKNGKAEPFDKLRDPEFCLRDPKLPLR